MEQGTVSRLWLRSEDLKTSKSHNEVTFIKAAYYSTSKGLKTSFISILNPFITTKARAEEVGEIQNGSLMIYLRSMRCCQPHAIKI